MPSTRAAEAKTEKFGADEVVDDRAEREYKAAAKKLAKEIFQARQQGYDVIVKKKMGDLEAIDGRRSIYVHVAGHHVEAEDLRVDTHGADVIDPVWELLKAAYHLYGVRPTLLERDFNFPPLPVLLQEVTRIRTLQAEVESGQVETG